MPKATQLNLDLDNKIGTLARLCRDLADGGVNLLAISAPESPGARSPVRLLVANRAQAEHAISKAGYAYVVEEVLFVELKNRPGALAKAVEKLAKAEIDVKYVYATADIKAQKSAAVIAVEGNNLPRAIELLG